MSITRRQSAQAISTTGTTSLTATLGSSTNAGNLLVAGVTISGGQTITSLKASNGTALTSAVSLSSASALAAIWYFPNCPSGITGITLTLPFNDCCIQLAEYAGCATTTPLDKTSSHDSGFSPSGTSWTSNATSTLAQTGELIVGFAAEWRSITTVMSAGTGYTPVLVSSDNSTIFEDILGNASTTGIAATGTATTLTNGQVYAVVAAFLPAGFAPVTPHSLMMTGVGN